MDILTSTYIYVDDALCDAVEAEQTQYSLLSLPPSPIVTWCEVWTRTKPARISPQNDICKMCSTKTVKFQLGLQSCKTPHRRPPDFGEPRGHKVHKHCGRWPKIKTTFPTGCPTVLERAWCPATRRSRLSSNWLRPALMWILLKPSSLIGTNLKRREETHKQSETQTIINARLVNGQQVWLAMGCQNSVSGTNLARDGPVAGTLGN